MGDINEVFKKYNKFGVIDLTDHPFISEKENFQLSNYRTLIDETFNFQNIQEFVGRNGPDA